MRFLGIVPKVFLFAFPYALLAFYLNSLYGVWNPRLHFSFASLAL
ncbi:hypothetical protein [Thermococcus eurythermalis]|nr:hypothetical protein [Thermococcus eurythermalis]